MVRIDAEGNSVAGAQYAIGVIPPRMPSIVAQDTVGVSAIGRSVAALQHPVGVPCPAVAAIVTQHAIDVASIAGAIAALGDAVCIEPATKPRALRRRKQESNAFGQGKRSVHSGGLLQANRMGDERLALVIVASNSVDPEPILTQFISSSTELHGSS